MNPTKDRCLMIQAAQVEPFTESFVLGSENRLTGYRSTAE